MIRLSSDGINIRLCDADLCEGRDSKNSSEQLILTRIQHGTTGSQGRGLGKDIVPELSSAWWHQLQDPSSVEYCLAALKGGNGINKKNTY